MLVKGRAGGAGAIPRTGGCCDDGKPPVARVAADPALTLTSSVHLVSRIPSWATWASTQYLDGGKRPPVLVRGIRTRIDATLTTASLNLPALLRLVDVT